MAHNSRIRAPGLWVLGSVIDPAEMEAFDAAQYAEINGDAGGTWAPAAAIIIGGNGLHVTGSFTADNADITITTGRYCTINSGAHVLGAAGSIVVWSGTNTYSAATTLVTFGTWTFDADATLHLNGATQMSATGTLVTALGSGINIGGALTVLSGGVATVASGGLLHLNSGGAITVASGGTITCAAGSTTALNGATTIASTGTVVCDAGSTVTVNGACVFGAGASLTANVTAPWTLNNVTTCNNQLVMATGSSLTVQSGSTLTTQFGAAVVRGANETRTGSETQSGTGAYTKRRYVLGSAIDHTYDGKDYDFIEVPTLAGTVNYTFSDLSPGDYVFVHVNRFNPSAAPYVGDVELKRGDASTIDTSINDGFPGSVVIFWNGSIWLKHVTG